MVRTCTQFLDKPMFVIKMNFSQSRWTDALRIEWLKELRYACEQTIGLIDQELKRYA